MLISIVALSAAADASSPFEQMAQEFTKETGLIAPGEACLGGTGGPSYDERYEAWSLWLAKRHAASMLPTLRRLRHSSVIAA
jgi:hypothetical protein